VKKVENRSTFREVMGKSLVSCIFDSRCTGRAKKAGHRLMTTILSNLNRLKKFFSLEDSLVNLHLAQVATLPCETLMLAKQATNNNLQGSVATHLKCGCVTNNQIKKGLLLSL